MHLQVNRQIYLRDSLQASQVFSQQTNHRPDLVISQRLSPLQVPPINLRVNHRECRLDNHQINPQVNRLEVQFPQDQQRFLLCNPQINLVNNQHHSHQIVPVSSLHQTQAIYHRYSPLINLPRNLRFSLQQAQLNNPRFILVANLLLNRVTFQHLNRLRFHQVSHRISLLYNLLYNLQVNLRCNLRLNHLQLPVNNLHHSLASNLHISRL